MEKKIITAIQNICSKSKQKVTSQRIFRFINKGALSIESELFQDFMNKLEIDGRNCKKKRGKIASFFINPIPPDNKKNDGSDSVERVRKSPELPKTIEKLESSAENDSCGLSSNVCTDNRFFHEEVLFLRKELDNKQKTIDNLLNMINTCTETQTNLVIIFTKLRMFSLSRLMQQLENDVFKRKIEIT